MYYYKTLLKVKAMNTILCLTRNILQLCNYTRALSVETNLGIVLDQWQITYVTSSFTIIIFNIYILVTCPTTSGSHVRTTNQK